MLRLMVADVDSPSYFVATAAVELGFFKEEGLNVELELVYGARSGPERLRDGTLHFFGGPAYAATRAFPAWKGARLLCALAQYSYWFMAVRADLSVRRGDMNAIKGLRISSSTAFPNMALKHMMASMRSREARTLFGATACVPQSARSWVLQKSISICGEAMARPERACIIS